MSGVAQLWTKLNNRRSAMLTRIEGYASLTIPRVMEPLGADENNATVNRDHQSVGAQGVNHLTNRLMLTMFSPSRPFIRMDLDADEKAKLMERGVEEMLIEEATFEGEMKAVRELDNRPVRPTLHEALLNLVVTGNVLLKLPKGENPTLFGIRDYVVRRSRDGKWRRLIVFRKHEFRDLEPALRDYMQSVKNGQYREDDEVELYTHVWKEDGRVKETLTVGDHEVTLEDFTGDYAEEDCPWHPEVWNLRSGAHYGTGHVEDLSSDLAALSVLSKAQVEAAILASEFRWLLRPGAMTTATDMQNSANGAVIPGEKDDLNLLHANIGQTLATIKDTAGDYVRRVGYGFLLNSAVTRDAERVTTEEIRQQALELETALGGVYSRLASTFQLAVAKWLLKAVNVNVNGTAFKVRIVTGLDALSRNGDLAALRGALGDIASLKALDPAVAAELNMAGIIKGIFMGWGVRPRQFQATEAQKQQRQEAAEAADARAIGREQALNQPQQ